LPVYPAHRECWVYPDLLPSQTMQLTAVPTPGIRMRP